MNDLQTANPFDEAAQVRKTRRIKAKAKRTFKAKPTKPAKLVPRKGNNGQGIGHNTLVDIDNVTLEFAWDVMAFDNQIETLTGKRRARFKAARNLGVKTATVVKMIKELKLGAAEVVERLNEENQHRKMFALPHHQNEIKHEGGSPDPDKQRKAARLDGMRCAFRGRTTSDNPHDAGLPLGQAWLEGYQEAAAKVAAAVKQTVISRVIAA